jgi:hypothetical protein
MIYVICMIQWRYTFFSIIYTRRFSGPGCQAAEEPAAEEALDHFAVVCNMAGLFFHIGNVIPSGYVKIAIENGHRNSEFSH